MDVEAPIADFSDGALLAGTTGHTPAVGSSEADLCTDRYWPTAGPTPRGGETTTPQAPKTR